MSSIDRRAVESSNIREVAYQADTQSLEVSFSSGGSFLYRGVPQQKFNEMVTAPSVGRFFHAEIRDHYMAEAGKLES